MGMQQMMAHLLAEIRTDRRNDGKAGSQDRCQSRKDDGQDGLPV
jgi:hypothetical protein